MILAVIPARANSVRLPHKNIKLLNGKPCIQYTFDAAKRSELINEIVCATNDDDVRKLAQKSDIEVIRLPEQITQSESKYQEYLQFVANEFEKHGRKATYICLLQPTSPLRTAEDIDSCLRLNRTLTTVCKGKENGAIYVIPWYNAFQGIGIHDQDGKPLPSVYQYEMPEERSVDIDELKDFDKAEAFLKGEQNDNSRVLHQLDRPDQSKRDDKGRSRNKPGRPSKISTL